MQEIYIPYNAFNDNDINDNLAETNDHKLENDSETLQKFRF